MDQQDPAYDFDIEYVKGKNNVVANALSRRPATFVSDECGYRLEGSTLGGVIQGKQHGITVDQIRKSNESLSDS